MIEERGIIRSVEKTALWVETVQKSACSSCGSEKNCGQNTLIESLLHKTTGTTTSIRALLPDGDRNHYRVDEQVLIGVPDHVVVSGTLLLYFLPLLTLVIGVTVAYQWSGADSMIALGALSGLIVGGGLVRLHSRHCYNDPAIQPVVLKKL